ncbi:MAG: hypoxanthine phosphoribosyltransferase [Anaerosomatales bacterium]|nr:hypoxanthine phosphoribosyltransferase [Anaerosomatales bacterium]MDT8433321.1 hypoxanthine phosphoribosyltransferase [Anaerosomatales bacterium]
MTRHYAGEEIVDHIIIPEQAIDERVAEIGGSITREHEGHALRLITVLRGGLFFLCDLCRQIDLPLTLDFMAISSFAGGSGGAVRITKDLDDPIEGERVIVVEDIIDTGLTLNYILSVLRQRRPASLEVCTLLDKDVRRIVDLPIAYRGFSVPDRFLVGYGLDLDARLRNLPYVATVHEDAALPAGPLVVPDA